MLNRSGSFRPCRTVITIALLAVTAVVAESADPISGRRVIDLNGTRNTRDIGGYETDDGRRTRWEQVLRSDNLVDLTTGDFRLLEQMGLATVVDLRSPTERRQAPTVWQGERPPRIVNLPIGSDDGAWMDRLNRMLADGNFSGQRAMTHMTEAYRHIGVVAEDQYRQLMTMVADPAAHPVLIHCTSGKDRSGIAVVLILEALGVSRETIRTDFMLTNEVTQVDERLRTIARNYGNTQVQVGARSRRGSPRAADFLPLIGVAPEMLDAFYEGIEADYGSLEAYLAAIGLDPEGREALADTLTE